MDTHNFTEILVTRLCHDLTGPISAVSNGLDLLQVGSDDIKTQAMNLVRQGSEESVARLRYYRIAYGMAELIGEVDMEDLRSIVEDMYCWNRIKLEWPKGPQNASINLTHNSARLLLNLILTAAGILIHNGTMTINLSVNQQYKSLHLHLQSTDNIMNKVEEVSNMMSAENLSEPVSLHNVQKYLTRHLLQQRNAKLTVDKKENEANFIVMIPIRHHD